MGRAGFEPAMDKTKGFTVLLLQPLGHLPEQFMFRDRTAAVYGSGRARTDDLQVKSPLLYQLSYRPIKGLNFQGADGGLSRPLG